MSLRVSANRARAAAVVLLALIAGTLFAPPSAAALDVPGPVENLTVAPGDGMIYASWSPPTNTGGSEILEYTMTQSVVGTLPTRHTFVTVLGLTPGSSHTMTVVARNAQGSSAPQTVTVTVGGSPRALPAELAPMKAGAAFSDYVGTVGYPAPTYSVTAGALPDGVTLNATTGEVAGTPTTRGPWTATIMATNEHGSAHRTYSGDVSEPDELPQLVTFAVSPLTWGVPVDMYLEATGSPTPTWEAAAVPAGLTLDPDGRLHGTPTVLGPRELTVILTNSVGVVYRGFTVVVLPDVPGAPTINGITPGNETMTVAITAPDSTGGLNVQRYEYTIDGAKTWHIASVTDGAFDIVGLDNGVEYDVAVRAVSVAGDSAPSVPATGTPFTTASAPSIDSTELGNGSLTVTFGAPTDSGGSPVTGYEYSVNGGSAWHTTDAMPGDELHLDGLENGTEYQVVVRAITDLAGPGAQSASAWLTPRSVPQAPTVVLAAPSNRTVTVQFEAPAFDGGNAISGYEYSIDGGKTWDPTTAMPGTSLAIRGLVNGTSYDVAVRGVNAAGPGTSSQPVAVAPTLVPVTLPTSGSADPVIPKVNVGEAMTIVDGELANTEITHRGNGVSVEGGGVIVDVESFDADGLPVSSAAGFTVPAGGAILVSGEGYQPGSIVDLWVMSEPTLLGQAAVGDDGTFSAMFALDLQLALGHHTLQVNGVNAQGQLVSINTGLEMVAASQASVDEEPVDGELPVTGTDLTLAGAAVLVLAAGIGLTLVGRQRRTKAQVVVAS